jgi:hypothetical protein
MIQTLQRDLPPASSEQMVETYREKILIIEGRDDWDECL